MAPQHQGKSWSPGSGGPTPSRPRRAGERTSTTLRNPVGPRVREGGSSSAGIQTRQVEATRGRTCSVGCKRQLYQYFTGRQRRKPQPSRVRRQLNQSAGSGRCSIASVTGVTSRTCALPGSAVARTAAAHTDAAINRATSRTRCARAQGARVRSAQARPAQARPARAPCAGVRSARARCAGARSAQARSARIRRAAPGRGTRCVMSTSGATTSLRRDERARGHRSGRHEARRCTCDAARCARADSQRAIRACQRRSASAAESAGRPARPSPRRRVSRSGR